MASAEAAPSTTSLAVEEKSHLQKSLRAFDMVFFTVCALVGLDILGQVAAFGYEGFTWLVVLVVTFLVPYALVMAELGSTFAQEGGPYEWTKAAFGRLNAGIASVLYWVTNPLWVGGSLCFIATETWSANIHPIGTGTVGDYVFKLLFIWFSIGVAIVSLRRGKWIPTIGAFTRVFALALFSITVVIYAIDRGVEGFALSDLSPSRAVFLGLVPLFVFALVGFELQSAAAEEMDDPQKDVPLSVIRSGAIATVLYAVPVFGILMVIPLNDVTGLTGFMDAVTATFDVYGGAQGFLVDVFALAFIFTLVTSGAVWMIGSDRVLAVAAYDGAFHGWFGRFNPQLGTPVRVNVMSGIASTIFMVAAVQLLNSGSAAAFTVVLTIAISTTLISYLWIFPTGIALRYKRPDVERAYRLGRSGNGLMWLCVALITFWTGLGSFVAVFPGVLEPLVGIDYGAFVDSWGVSRVKYEVLTLGTLAVVVGFAVLMYALAKPVRDHPAEVPLAEAQPHAALGDTPV